MATVGVKGLSVA